MSESRAARPAASSGAANAWRTSAPVRIVLNPVSGGGAGRRLRPRIERELGVRGIHYAVAETAARGDAVRLARSAVEQGASVVAAAGGDGTVHEVANGLLQATPPGNGADRPALAVIPTGTGNDFAKMIDGATHPDDVFEILRSGERRALDVGRVEWEGAAEYFVNGMGTGIDVEVVRQIERLPRVPGVLGYLVGLLRALWHYRPTPLLLRYDSAEIERDPMIVAVGNGACIGGGFYVCPAARPDDGRFDICIVNELSFPRLLWTISRVMRGTHTGMPGVEMHQARAAEMATVGATPFFFQLDGELRETRGGSRLRIELLPGRLPVLALSDRSRP